MPPPRLAPLLDQFDFARARLANRITGPFLDSGDVSEIPVSPMTDAEYHWPPIPGYWAVRRRADGPGPRATHLAGSGEWGRDAAPDPSPPPFTTIAWRLSHLSEMLALRADHTAGTHAQTRDDYPIAGDITTAVAAFDTGAAAWRNALLTVDDAALDTVGYCTYLHGSDAETLFLDVVWWVN